MAVVNQTQINAAIALAQKKIATLALDIALKIRGGNSYDCELDQLSCISAGLRTLTYPGDLTSSDLKMIIGLINGTGPNVYAPVSIINNLTYNIGGNNSTVGVNTFLQLLDTPKSYTGQAGKVVIVNAGENGLEFSDPLASNNVIISDYTSMMSLQASNSLQKGNWYEFDYQTIHKIPYTSVINTGPVEVLRVFALTSNTFDLTSVKSLAYPQDIIYWRPDDNQVVNDIEDTLLVDGNAGLPDNYPPQIVGGGVNYYSPSTPRPGRIYYREDTISRLSAPYDFRACKFRRWKVKNPITLTTPYVTWTDNTSYNQGDIVYNAGTYYMITSNLNSGTGGFVVDYGFDLTPLILGFTNGTFFPYISPVPDNFVIFPDNKLAVQVDNTQFIDLYTFNNPGFGMGGGTLNNFNCHIKNYLPAWLEQVTWEYYPNIVFMQFANNVEVDVFCENLTIVQSCNLRIDSYTRNTYISLYNSYLCNTEIGGNNTNLFIYAEMNSVTSKGNLYHTIGSGNNGLLLLFISNLTIGNCNYNSFVYGSTACEIGNENQSIIMYLNNNCKVGSENNQISFLPGGTYNSCKDNNAGILFPKGGYQNTMGSYNSNITSLRPTGTTVEGVAASSVNFNIIGNNNSGHTLCGAYNIYRDGCASVIVDSVIPIQRCVFDVKSPGGLSIYSASHTAGPPINGIEFVIPLSAANNRMDYDTLMAGLPVFITGLIYNITDNTAIYAQQVTSYTSGTSYTTYMYKIPLVP